MLAINNIYKNKTKMKGVQMIYHTINEIPSEGRYLINELINRGIIESYNGRIDLEETIYKMIIILAKLGLI